MFGLSSELQKPLKLVPPPHGHLTGLQFHMEGNRQISADMSETSRGTLHNFGLHLCRPPVATGNFEIFFWSYDRAERMLKDSMIATDVSLAFKVWWEEIALLLTGARRHEEVGQIFMAWVDGLEGADKMALMEFLIGAPFWIKED